MATQTLQTAFELVSQNPAAFLLVAGKGFWATVCSIELTDFSLSFDNAVAAVGVVAGSARSLLPRYAPFSPPGPSSRKRIK